MKTVQENRAEEPVLRQGGGAEKDAEVCEYLHVHPDAVERVRRALPPEEQLQDLAEAFRVFGDTTRVRILYVLHESEMCVCDLAEILHMTVSAISHQLRILKQAQLVRPRREGKTVFYALKDRHVRDILSIGMEHITEEAE